MYMGIKTDIEILEIVDGLSDTRLRHYSFCYYMNDLRHYLKIQCGWIETERYFLGMELEKRPTELEVISAWETHRNAERFKAYYVMRYPEKVSIIEPEYYI